MAPRRPAQFGLFGGEEEVGEGEPSDPENARAPEKPQVAAEWKYPAAAFPPDPWEALYAQTVDELEDALGAQDEQVRRALCRYFKCGLAASYDHGELCDLLC